MSIENQTQIPVHLENAGIYSTQRDKLINDNLIPLVKHAACVNATKAHVSFIGKSEYTFGMQRDVVDDAGPHLSLTLYPGPNSLDFGDGNIPSEYCNTCPVKTHCSMPVRPNPGHVQQGVREVVFLGRASVPKRSSPHAPFEAVNLIVDSSDGQVAEGVQAHLTSADASEVLRFISGKKDTRCGYGPDRFGPICSISNSDGLQVGIKNDSGTLVTLQRVIGNTIQVGVSTLPEGAESQRLFKSEACMYACPIKNSVVLPTSGRRLQCTGVGNVNAKGIYSATLTVTNL